MKERNKISFKNLNCVFVYLHKLTADAHLVHIYVLHEEPILSREKFMLIVTIIEFNSFPLYIHTQQPKGKS
jgi:hypothetical protein